MRRVTFGVLAIAVTFHASTHAVAQRKSTIQVTPVAQSATPANVLQYVPDDVVAVGTGEFTCCRFLRKPPCTRNFIWMNPGTATTTRR